ncbi:MAG: cell division/cell wall cluster transcriptional repressor MraZ [Acidimicrobiia bacterium]|nr:cell division/cell wall cluster transcriptional repressor MraZ [Acidimicrobiia bacterium]
MWRQRTVFVGTFEHSLDDKGRLVLPTAFRGRLADGGYLTLWESCLALFAPAQFEDFVERLNEKVRSTEASPSALRVFMANASEVRPDSQGRFPVPTRLREYAGLESSVVLAGVRDHIELWAPPRWADVSTQGDASLADAVARLGIF